MGALPTGFLPDDFDSLDQLLADTETEWADLAALHGNFGKWNDLRKIQLAEAKLRIRESEVLPKGVRRWTDDLLDCAARCDVKYRCFVEDGTEEAKAFHKLDQYRERVASKKKSLMYSPVR